LEAAWRFEMDEFKEALRSLAREALATERRGVS
jgi:hypothetical protein